MSNTVTQKTKTDAPKGQPSAKDKVAPKAAVAPKKQATAPQKPKAAKEAETKPAATAAQAPSATPEKKSTTKSRIIELLSRKDGVTDAEMVKEFGWKGNHVARGRRSTLAKEFRDKKTGQIIGKFTRTPSGDTAYKIEKAEPEADKQAAKKAA